MQTLLDDDQIADLFKARKVLLPLGDQEFSLVQQPVLHYTCSHHNPVIEGHPLCTPQPTLVRQRVTGGAFVFDPLNTMLVRTAEPFMRRLYEAVNRVPVQGLLIEGYEACTECVGQEMRLEVAVRATISGAVRLINLYSGIHVVPLFTLKARNGHGERTFRVSKSAFQERHRFV